MVHQMRRREAVWRRHAAAPGPSTATGSSSTAGDHHLLSTPPPPRPPPPSPYHYHHHYHSPSPYHHHSHQQQYYNSNHNSSSSSSSPAISGCWVWLRCLCLGAMIPLLFLLRAGWTTVEPSSSSHAKEPLITPSLRLGPDRPRPHLPPPHDPIQPLEDHPLLPRVPVSLLDSPSDATTSDVLRQIQDQWSSSSGEMPPFLLDLLQRQLTNAALIIPSSSVQAEASSSASALAAPPEKEATSSTRLRPPLFATVGDWVELTPPCRSDWLWTQITQPNSSFTQWALPWLEQTVQAARPVSSSSPAVPLLLDPVMKMQWQQEWYLQLLEVYASHQPPPISDPQAALETTTTTIPICDYSNYRPSVTDWYRPVDQPGDDHEHDLAAIAQRLQAWSQEHQRHLDPGGTSSTTTFLLPRVVYVIVAFQDEAHLAKLIQALLPSSTDPAQAHAGHYILIHVEKFAPEDFVQRVWQLADRYSSPKAAASGGAMVVVVIQGGHVFYGTDSVSMIQYRLMRWVTIDLHLDYDYYVALDGAAFPLVSPREFMNLLTAGRRQGRRVWLGELLQGGQPVGSDGGGAGAGGEQILRQKRLVYTASRLSSEKPPPGAGPGSSSARERGDRAGLNDDDGEQEPDPNSVVFGTLAEVEQHRSSVPPLKLFKRLPRSATRDWYLPPALVGSLRFKSTSGNQGIYERAVVESLLESVLVRQLFALSKYACCCCWEERNWIAALDLIGYSPTALEATSMFQVWNDAADPDNCVNHPSRTGQPAMSNAVLTMNASYCYQSEDPGRLPPRSWRGHETWAALLEARSRGIPWARKFRSDHPSSAALVDRVVQEMWDSPPAEEEGTRQ